MNNTFKSFQLACDVISWVIDNRNIENPIDARYNSKRTSRRFFETLYDKYKINFSYNFWLESFKKYPDIIESIKNYISTWKIEKNLPKLWLWNHQAFWLEALWAYDYFPIDWKIVLKDELLTPPLFWAWIKSIDPIVYYRWEINAEDRRNAAIKTTILEKNAVLIYPEWTRSKDWRIRWFDYKKYKAWYDIITNLANEVNSQVAIITSDTFDALPNTLEESLLFMWDLNFWNITFTIDIIDASLYENIREFNNDVKNILETNLKKNLY